MTDDERQHVINELQKVIGDTQATLSRFEATGMEDEMREYTRYAGDVGCGRRWSTACQCLKKAVSA